MMGFSCMKAVYEYTPYLHSRKKYYNRTQHSGASSIRKSEPTKEIPLLISLLRIEFSLNLDVTII